MTGFRSIPPHGPIWLIGFKMNSSGSVAKLLEAKQ